MPEQRFNKHQVPENKSPRDLIKETTSADGRIRKIDIKIADNKVVQGTVEAPSKEVSNYLDIAKKETNMKS